MFFVVGKSNKEESKNDSQEQSRDESREHEQQIEIMRLRFRIKELTHKEIELEDKIDMLESENRMLQQKVTALNLMSKRDVTSGHQENRFQQQVKEMAERYELKIKILTAKIVELEKEKKGTRADEESLYDFPQNGKMEFADNMSIASDVSGKFSVASSKLGIVE